MARGDWPTARQFVQRAAQCDCHQCYKLLWLRSLEPILNWLAAELLTEDGASLAATEDGELRLLANRIQCLAIRGHNTEAGALADALVPGKIYRTDTATEIMLGWLATGEFARPRRWASALPRVPECRAHAIIEQVCDLFLPEDDKSRASTTRAPDTPDLDQRTGDALRQLAQAQEADTSPSPNGFMRMCLRV